MRTFIMLIVALAAAGSLRAQSLEAFKEQLARPAVSEAALGTACVTVREDAQAARAVKELSSGETQLRFRGYRVCIFFDNGQDARAKAVEAKTLFEEHFPGIRVYMVYENPYFKVTAGDCLTSEEAIILKGRVQGVFPKAYVKNEELTAADLVK